MTDYPDLSKGAAWEYRVQRALFLAGWYVRRSVNLRERVMGSPQTMAEVDVLCVGFDPWLSRSSMVGECKDRKASTKEADRIIWLLGLARLLRVDHVLFAKTVISQATIQFAKPAGVALWDQAAVQAIESRFKLRPDSDFFGSTNVSLQEDVIRPSRKASALKNRPLRAACDYVTGAFWYGQNPARTKRLKGFFEAVDEATDLNASTRSGLIAEGLIALLASGYTTAGQLTRLSPGFGDVQQETALASGAADAAALREIAGRADDYYQNALIQAVKSQPNEAASVIKVPRLANSIAEPPEWTQSYLGFARRLGEQPLAATDVLRYADLILFESILAEQNVAPLVDMLFPDGSAHLRISLELGALFLNRIWGVDDEVLSKILSRHQNGPTKAQRKSRSKSGKRAQAQGPKLFD
jgi:hypothetical protein